MDEMTDAPKPITGFFQAWWALLKAEHATMRGAGSAKATKDAALHLQMTEEQVKFFCLGEILANIALVLWVSIAYGGWFVEHGLVLDKHGNGLDLITEIAMLLAAHVLVSFLLALIWLKIHRPLGFAETRQVNDLNR